MIDIKQSSFSVYYTTGVAIGWGEAPGARAPPPGDHE